jgi:hypothetical protein
VLVELRIDCFFTLCLLALLYKLLLKRRYIRCTPGIIRQIISGVNLDKSRVNLGRPLINRDNTRDNNRNCNSR